jgi:predicted metal-dependent hydrolase
MVSQIKLGDISVDVILKDIKNVHLSVYPPTGRVRISAPSHMSMDTIRVFAISKLDWIKKQQFELKKQKRETQRDFVERESHFVWGKRYLLSVTEHDQAPTITLKGSKMRLAVRPQTDRTKRHAILDDWYREQLKAVIPNFVAKWEPRMGVTVDRFYVRRMKTKWGSCNPAKHSIRLNTELARKPRECLEYLVVHEMAHLIEPTHNARFIALMDRLLPQWRTIRDQLNSFPLAHSEWRY